MGQDASVDTVLSDAASWGWQWFHVVRSEDLGCHESWMASVYHAATPFVLVLHDDDVLKPDFGAAWHRVILPSLEHGYAVTWRGEHVRDDGRTTATEYWHGDTRVMSRSELLSFLLRPSLSLSPAVTVFRRSTLISALKEGEAFLTHADCLLRPGMLLGTEVLAHLRSAQSSAGWVYLNEVLSQYGVHDGSGTIQAETAGDLKPLIAGYNVARNQFSFHAVPPPTQGRLLFVYSVMSPRDAHEQRRTAEAMRTWRFHFDQGTMMEYPFDTGTAVPLVREVFDYAMSFARPGDIIVYANRDVCLTTMAVQRIRWGLRNVGLVACPRRSMTPIPDGRHFATVRHCKPDGGYDVFAFTPEWWTANRARFPDMFIGHEAWDTVLRHLAQYQYGDAAYLDDVCYHEDHESRWKRNRHNNPFQSVNRRLALAFFTARNNPWLIRQLT